jgi:molybdenum cofactor synthesis domain-containing protein
VSATTAAVVAIGSELLSGKVRDENLAFVATALRPLGVDLRLALVVSDDTQAIVDAIHYARDRADVVITTGGVGPTHDDITLAAVAAAFDLPLDPVPSLVKAIEVHYGERVNDELRSMALAPRGVELLQPVPFFLPVFKVGTVHVFPGDPSALKLLFNGWKGTLSGAPYYLTRTMLDLDEGEVAPLLSALVAAHPQVEVGSYPRFDSQRPYKVLVTVDGKDREQVVAAADDLAARIHIQFDRQRILAREGPDLPDPTR